MLTQLNPPIPLHVLGKGSGHALAVIDYGQEHNLLWVTALDANGEIWCAPNPTVRMGRNWSMGRAENPLITRDKSGHASPSAAPPPTAADPTPAQTPAPDLCATCAADAARQ